MEGSGETLGVVDCSTGLVRWGRETAGTGIGRSGIVGGCRETAGTGAGRSGKVGRLFSGSGMTFSVLGLVKSSRVGWSYFLGLCFNIILFV